MKKFWLDITAIIIFVIIVGIFFYPTLLQNKLPIPSDALVGLYHPWRDLFADTNPRGIPFKNFLITDPVRQEIPWRKIAIDEWKTQSIPFWNPYSFSGTTLIGNIQAGVFYPFNIIFLLFDFPIAWTLLIVLQPLLGGIFMFAFLRFHKISRVASLIGALSWSFSGFSVAWLTWGTIGHVSLWLPLTFLSIDRLVVSKNRVWFVVFILSLTFQFFAGHAQIAFYASIFSFAYALWRTYRKSPKKLNVPWWLSSGILFLMVLTSFQWIPSLHALQQSSRVTEIDLWTKSGWFLPWQHLIQFIVPDFFGNPSTMNYWGEWNYGEFIGYIGVVGAIGVSFASLYIRRYLFWFGALLVAFLFLLPTLVAKLPYVLRIPLLQSLQPTRIMVIVDFILAVLAVYGLDNFFKSKNKKLWMGVFLLGVIVIVIWVFVYGQVQNPNWLVTKRNLILPTILFGLTVFLLIFRKVSIVKVLLILIAAFDLLRFGWKFTPFTTSNYFFPQTRTLEFLESQNKPFRIASIDKELLPPNTASWYGLEDIAGYDPIYNSRYEEYFAAMNRGEPDISGPFGFNRILTLERFDTPLLPLLNVRYILSLHELHNPYLSLVAREGQTRVYEDSRSLPRAYFVTKIVVAKEKRDIIHMLYDSLFNATKTAVVEEPIIVGDTSLSDKDRVMISFYDQSRMDLEVSAADKRLLILSNIWSPFWHATIDGKVAKILRTNYTFQGLVIEKGDHKIILSAGI